MSNIDNFSLDKWHAADLCLMRCGEFERAIRGYFEWNGSVHFQWELIYEFVRDYWEELMSDCYLRIFLEYFVDKLLQLDCEDAHLVAFLVNLHDCFLGVMPIGSLHVTTSKQKHLDQKCIVITELLRKEGRPGDIWDEVDHNVLEVGLFIVKGDWRFVQLLVKYGILCFNPPLNQMDLVVVKMTVGRSCNIITENSNSEDLKKKILDTFNHTFESMTLAYYNNLETEQKIKVRRECVVLYGVKMIHYMFDKYNYLQDYIKCYRLYFESIPEPYLTIKEIEKAIYFPFGKNETVVNLPRIQECLNDYQKLFPDSDTLETRSLQHLSRCAVRAHLRNYGPLPRILSELQLPVTIKDYILVKE